MMDNRVETAHISSFIRKDKTRKRNVDKVSTEEADIDKHLDHGQLGYGGDSCAGVRW